MHIPAPHFTDCWALEGLLRVAHKVSTALLKTACRFGSKGFEYGICFSRRWKEHSGVENYVFRLLPACFLEIREVKSGN
jgi:hypothetical protein